MSEPLLKFEGEITESSESIHFHFRGDFPQSRDALRRAIASMQRRFDEQMKCPFHEPENSKLPISMEEICDWPGCTNDAFCLSSNVGGALACRRHFGITNGKEPSQLLSHEIEAMKIMADTAANRRRHKAAPVEESAPSGEDVISG